MTDLAPAAGATPDRDPAAAERLLRAINDPTGSGPLAWAAAPLLGAGRVLDLGCGSGALADEFAPGRWLGVDPDGAGRRPRLRALAHALPLEFNAVDGVVLLLRLPLLPELDAVFAELRRVLRPGGTLVVVVPSIGVRSMAELRLAPLLGPVRRGHWPNRSALDHAGWLLTAADFAVLTDERVPFALPLPDPDTTREHVAALPAAGLWPPDLPHGERAALAAALAARSGPGRVLPVPMRRLVARR